MCCEKGSLIPMTKNITWTFWKHCWPLDVPPKASLAGSNVKPHCSRDIAWLSVYSPASLLRVGQQTFPGVPKVVEGQHAEWPAIAHHPTFSKSFHRKVMVSRTPPHSCRSIWTTSSRRHTFFFWYKGCWASLASCACANFPQCICPALPGIVPAFIWLSQNNNY